LHALAILEILARHFVEPGELGIGQEDMVVPGRRGATPELLELVDVLARKQIGRAVEPEGRAGLRRHGSDEEEGEKEAQEDSGHAHGSPYVPGLTDRKLSLDGPGAGLAVGLGDVGP